MPPYQINPLPPRLIVLIGFMGAGKSTVGPLLAARLGWRFLDVDAHLEARTGSTIAELFAARGEAGFRRIEAEALAHLWNERELVLALGGGAIESELTRALLEQSRDVCVVFLRAPFPVLVERCENQPGARSRPLLQERQTLHSRFQSRLRHYENAHIAVDTDGLRPQAVADLILSRLPESALALPKAQGARNI